MNRILIINPFGIGDVLFTTPVIKALKDNLPGSHIGYWCNERVFPILKDNPGIDRIFTGSRGDLKKIFQKSFIQGLSRFFGLLSQIRKEEFEICLDFSLDHRYSLLAKLAGIKKRVGFNYKNRSKFLTHKIDIECYSSKHIVEYYLDLLKPLNIEPSGGNLELFASKEEEKAKIKLKREGVLDKQLTIGIAPGAGASWGKDANLKHWPAIKFAQLADKLKEELRAQVLILGDESERPIADIIIGAVKHKPVDLAGKTTLLESAAIIKNLNLLITNDGGPLHMAVALGVKTVSIFGPVDEKVYGPYPPSNNHRVIKSGIPCRPCYKNFRLTECMNDRRCIKDISVDEVYAAVGELI